MARRDLLWLGAIALAFGVGGSAVGCGDDDDRGPGSSGDGQGGDGGDWCEIEGRYGDGPCDHDCPGHDSDCDRADPCFDHDLYDDGICHACQLPDPDCAEADEPLDPCELFSLYDDGQCDECPGWDHDCDGGSAGAGGGGGGGGPDPYHECFASDPDCAPPPDESIDPCDQFSLLVDDVCHDCRGGDREGCNFCPLEAHRSCDEPLDPCAVLLLYVDGACHACPSPDPDCTADDTPHDPCELGGLYADGNCHECPDPDPDCVVPLDPCASLDLYGDGTCHDCPSYDSDCDHPTDQCAAEGLYDDAVCHICPDYDAACDDARRDHCSDGNLYQDSVCHACPAPDWNCDRSGLANPVDSCDALGLYGDGTCHSCPAPDPDCDDGGTCAGNAAPEVDAWHVVLGAYSGDYGHSPHDILVGDMPVTIVVAAFDRNGDALDFTYGFEVGDGTFDNGESALTTTERNAELYLTALGITNVVRVTATDHCGLSATATVDIDVVNQPPHFDQPSVTWPSAGERESMHRGETADITAPATDPDEPFDRVASYTYQVTPVRAGTFQGTDDASPETASFLPSPDYVGPATLEVTVEDGFGATASFSRNLLITNAPPEFAVPEFSLSASTIAPLTSATVTVNALSPDGDALEYKYYLSGSAGGSLDVVEGAWVSAGQVQYTASAAAGNATITVYVRDFFGAEIRAVAPAVVVN